MSEGQQIGDYRVVRELGRGGAGVVYEVSAPGSDRQLALKLLHSKNTSDEALARFGREAQLLAQIGHPSVVRILDLKRTERGDPYIVTDLVPGEELAKVARGRPLPWAQSAKIVRELADALAALHEKGIVHRDLKPQNVILHKEGHPVLLDFGLAREADDTERLTQTGAFLGTPAYAAPEQASGSRKIGPSADVYSLGAILYFLLSGHAPYTGSMLVVLAKLVSGKLPSWPSEHDPSVPAELEAICRRAMQHPRADRTPSAAQLRDELDLYLSGDSTAAASSAEASRVLIGAAALLLAVLGAVLWVTLNQEAPRADDPPPAPLTKRSGKSAPPDDPTEEPPAVEITPAARLAAQRFKTVADAKLTLDDDPNSAYVLAILHAVHDRNRKECLWKGEHAELGALAPPPRGRAIPPRSLFVWEGRSLITYGGLMKGSGKGAAMLPGLAKAWSVETQVSKALNDSLIMKSNVVLGMPGVPESALLFETVRQHYSWHADGGYQGADGTDARMKRYRHALEAHEHWAVRKPGDDYRLRKPVTAAATNPGGREFALGTGRGGKHRRAGVDAANANLVLRVPFPLTGRTSDAKVRSREVRLKSGPVRALAYGPAPEHDLWILGEHELFRWPASRGTPELIGTSKPAWWTLAVDRHGRPLAGGVAGVSLFSPEGGTPQLFKLPRFASVNGLIPLDDDHLLAVGTTSARGGVTAVLRVDGAQDPLVHLAELDVEALAAYAGASVSPQSRRVCLTRWDGEFEVFDLDALLPLDRLFKAQTLPQKPTSEPPPAVDSKRLARLRQRAAKFETLREVDRQVNPADPQKKGIRAEVLRRNGAAPVWGGVHGELTPEPRLPPRLRFLPGRYLLTFGGEREGETAPLKRWTRDRGVVQELQPGELEAPPRAVVPDPRYSFNALAFSELASEPLRLTDRAEHVRPPVPEWGTVRASFGPDMLATLGDRPGLVSAATLEITGTELAVGTTAEGGGPLLLRIPLTGLSPAWRLAKPEAGHKAFQQRGSLLELKSSADVAALDFYGRTLYALAGGLVVWDSEGARTVCRPKRDERWRALLTGGFLLVGGTEGLIRLRHSDLATPLRVIQEPMGGQVTIKDVHTLLRLQKDLVFAAGADADQRAVWVVFQLQNRVAKIRLSHVSPNPTPYTDASFTGDFSMLGLMHENGRFEVWETEAIKLLAFESR